MYAQNKKDILSYIVNALFDENLPVMVETLDAKNNGSHFTGAHTPQMPAPKQNGEYKTSDNARHAKSIKIGKDISMQRMFPQPVNAQTKAGMEYKVDRGFYYIVRTPKGEMRFEENDPDFQLIWGSALAKYDRLYGNDTPGQIKQILSDRIQDGDLRKRIMQTAIRRADNKTKFERAGDQLKSMGIDSNMLAKYLSDHQNG